MASQPDFWHVNLHAKDHSQLKPLGFRSACNLKKSLNLPYVLDHNESVRTKPYVTKNVLKLNITVYGFARIFNFGESLNRFVRHGNRLLTSETSKRILMGQ